MENTLSGLTVSVLRQVTLRPDGKPGRIMDCTNGGVTSKFDDFVLVGPGIDEIFPATATRPALKIVRRNIGGKQYVHAEPVAPCPSNCVGYMFGGNFVTCSDSRVRAINEYPIPVHDRVETPQQYDRLSR
jgi:hypothetical protein